MLNAGSGAAFVIESHCSKGTRLVIDEGVVGARATRPRAACQPPLQDFVNTALVINGAIRRGTSPAPNLGR